MAVTRTIGSHTPVTEQTDSSSTIIESPVTALTGINLSKQRTLNEFFSPRSDARKIPQSAVFNSSGKHEICFHTRNVCHFKLEIRSR